jgi:hypothetical protein
MRFFVGQVRKANRMNSNLPPYGMFALRRAQHRN